MVSRKNTPAFIIIVLTILSCSSPISNEQEASLIRGIVFDVFMNDTLKIQPNSIIIDGTPVSVNDQHEFNIDLYPGDYPIQVISDDHFLLDTVVTISESDSLLSLEIQSKMLDYFPVQVGNEWIFNGSAYVSDPAGSYFSNTEKRLVWEIIEEEMTEDSDGTIYTLSSNYQGTTISGVIFNDYLPTDTTTLRDSTIFTLSINNNRIKFAGDNKFPNISTILWGEYGYSFSKNGNQPFLIIEGDFKGLPRFYPLSRIDSKTLIVDKRTLNGAGHLILKPGIGFSEMHYSCCGGNYNDGQDLILESFEKGN